MTVLKINMSKGKYYVQVSITNNGYHAETTCVVDTGAGATQVPRYFLDQIPDLCLTKDVVRRRGIVPNIYRDYSQYRTDLLVGDILVPNSYILIPKDDDSCIPLLGMDILSRLDFVQLGDALQLLIKNTARLDTRLRVNQANAKAVLLDILRTKHREDLFPILCNINTDSIDLEYNEFYLFVAKLIKNTTL